MLTRTRLRALLATGDTAGHRQSDARIRYDSSPLHGETSCTSKDPLSAGIDPCVPTVAQHAVCRARPVSSLFELEVRRVQRTVVQHELELPARVRPRLVGLPHVDVLVRTRVVLKAAATLLTASSIVFSTRPAFTQVMSWTLGYPAAMIFSPWFPQPGAGRLGGPARRTR
jgi:hypothetical protein